MRGHNTGQNSAEWWWFHPLSGWLSLKHLAPQSIGNQGPGLFAALSRLADQSLWWFWQLQHWAASGHRTGKWFHMSCSYSSVPGFHCMCHIGDTFWSPSMWPSPNQIRKLELWSLESLVPFFTGSRKDKAHQPEYTCTNTLTVNITYNI